MKVLITRDKLDDLAVAVAEKAGLTTPLTIAQMQTAVENLSPGGGGTLITKSINTNGTYTARDDSADGYSSVTVNVPTPTPTLQTKTKTYTPTESAQTESVSADAGYDGIDTVNVTVNAISSTYVGSQVARNDSSDLTVSGSTVTAPAGYYANSASKSLPSADPWIEIEDGFFTDSNERKFRYRGNVVVDESEGDTAGYLPNGYSKSSEWSVLNAIPANTTVTPTKSAQTIGNMGTVMEGAVTIAAVPEMDFWEGYIQRDNYETINGQRYWKPTCGIQAFTSGWLDAGTYGEVDTFPAVAANTTITPTTSAQTIGGANTMMEGAVTVAAMPTGTAGTPTATKGTVSNHAVSVTPSVTNTTGYIDGGTKTGTAVSVSASELVSGTYNVDSSGTKDVTNYASASVPSGSATPAASISGTSATVSTGTNTLTLSKTVSNTPQVSAGYVSIGTAGNSNVSLTASVTTKAAATITPGTTNQTIASGTYLTGTQTISGDANLVAGNIKNGTSIFGVTGTYEGSNPVKTKTGTFTGNGTRTIDVACDFEPDLVYVSSDPGTTASSGTVAFIIARDMMAASRYRNNSTTNSHYAVTPCVNLNTSGSSYSWRATYANSKVTLYSYSNNARALLTNGRTYTYKFVKWTT